MSDNTESAARLRADEGAELARLRDALARSVAREQALQQTIDRLEGELAVQNVPPPSRPGTLQRLVRRGRRVGVLPPPPAVAAPVGGGPTAKQVLRARTEAELDGLLHGSGRVQLPCAGAPAVSILLVLFNQAPLTLACLRSIAAIGDVDAEVIIVDNASSDQTGDLLDRLDGARVIRNQENRHFLLASNQGATEARGDAILLLNNDAVLRPGALGAALGVLAAQPDVGAVGGMIVLPDGTLQEAGSIIWNDGSCLGYGRGRFPSEAEFQFVRDVDYCSGAFLLVRRALFDELGGFDTAFAPAYYEETDFCMRLRAAGHRIVYHPLAAIDHYEFASSTSNEAALALQRRNHTLFAERHRDTLLADHLPQGTEPLRGRMRSAAKGRVLVIEDRVPFPAMGAGYPRAAELLHALERDGWFVTLYPLLFPEGQWDKVYAAFPRSMEVILGGGEDGLAGFLKARAGYYDTIIVSRPHNMRIFLDKGGAGAGARIIYDAEAVFASREFLRLALAGAPVSAARQQAELREEMKLALAADRVITVSAREAAPFTQAGCTDVTILGHALAPQPTPSGHAARHDLLFVGALDDDPSPNTDSLLWFAAEVMPLLDGLIGDDWQLLVAGRAGAARVRALAGKRIRILGRVEELGPLYAQARLSIAPTRYAGGIPHKVHEAAARGVPVVVTSLLAEQLGWSDGQELLVADTPEAFAGACARLFRDGELWDGVRTRALARLVEDCDVAVFAAGVAAVMAPSQGMRKRPVVVRKRAPAPGNRHVYRLIMLARRARRVLPFVRSNGLAYTFARIGAELRLRTGTRDYATWIRLYDQLRASDLRAIAAHIETFALHPAFSLLLRADPGTDLRELQATLASLEGQLYGSWQLCVDDRAGSAEVSAFLQGGATDTRIRVLPPDGAGAGRLLALATGAFVIAIEPGDVLRPQTLYRLAVEHDRDPEVSLLYTDEDRIDAEGVRSDPHFKPDFSPELLLDPRGLGGLVALRRDAVIAAGGFGDAPGAFYDAVLRVAEQVDPLDIRHVPSILVHRSRTPAYPGETLVPIVSAHLARTGVTADVTMAAQGLRVAYALPDPPRVTVIVPTRDRLALLRRCMQGLMAETDYPALEIIVVDNASREPQTLRLFERLRRDPRVKVLPFPYAFNYAAMNNRAVEAASGEVVVLLNNDIAIRDPGWLREMVSQVMRPKVGAVGAKLYYGNGTLQHGGVVTGIFTVAGHPFRQFPADHSGHHGSLFRTQALSCVTAACMAVRRSVYQEVGGLDEVNLTVSYNDVDFCLRLRERGYRIIWTPHAELDHLESVSRGQDTSPENLERALREEAFMTRKWGAVLGHDPFYNPNLTKQAEDFGLAFPPRVSAPWRDPDK